jgi:hypothetical protein
MPIKISKALRAKLPEEQRESIEDALWEKSGHHCFLCDAELNRASDDIEADHDVPESDGGATDLANLNLAHVACNRAKRDAKTIDIKPYLRVKAYARNRETVDRYDAYLPHFDIKPSESVVTIGKSTVAFELPDGTKSEVPVFKDSAAGSEVRYVFVSLPRSAIFNDDQCQPRAVKLEHAYAIYIDLQSNVLHEPPSCRLSEAASGKPLKLLMFDGQHKTIATWMNGKSHVTCKVYLDLDLAQANKLVNSVQAKIKKLPLSPFELAAKMADEWQNQFQEYEESVGSENVSEKGFIAWLPKGEQKRGKDALNAAILQNVLGDQDLRIQRHVQHSGAKTKPIVPITEQALKARFLERLLTQTPQTALGSEAQRLRSQEALNVVRYSNMLSDLVFEPAEGEDEMNSVQFERANRVKFQSALGYVAGLMRRCWIHVAAPNALSDPMSQALSEDDWNSLRIYVDRIVSHPVWTTDYAEHDFMPAVKQALEKNQDAEAAFQGAALTFSYLLAGTEDTAYKNAWRG